jgi:hypothetical protein
LVHLIHHQGFVPFQAVLNVHLELADVVQDAIDLCVELFAKRVGSRGQLFISIEV